MSDEFAWTKQRARIRRLAAEFASAEAVCGEGPNQMIYTVEYPKSKTAKQGLPLLPDPPKPMAADHPFPWKTGESNETSCDVLASNGRLVTSFRGSEITMCQRPSRIARMFVEMMNAAHSH